MSDTYDIAVIGSGFAGSLMAMVAQQSGYSVALIEKYRHPRIVIGESTTPLSNLLLEELADTYNLPMLTPLTKWGAWQKNYPAIGCGLKRGFSFFHHHLDNPSTNGFRADQQLLVAASPHNEIADTHWFRSDVDQFLVEQAQSIGVTYLDEFSVQEIQRSEGQWTIAGHRASSPLSIKASFIIDATGPRGFLHRTLGLTESPLPRYPATCSLYCHFKGVEELAKPDRQGSHAPFPIDDAAVHHIFDGGWVWVLRFNNGWTSAGISATEELSESLQLSQGEPAWLKLLEKLPLVKQQFTNARPATRFTYLPRLSFRSNSITGDGWAMLPATAGFVDPLLSTGFPLSLLGIQRLASALNQKASTSDLSTRLDTYAAQTSRELLATSTLIGSLYTNMGDFDRFRTLSLLYFAAASYSETARRLGRPELADGFMLSNSPIFAPECQRLLNIARTTLDKSEQWELTESVYNLIQPYDVAGLCRQPEDNCYPLLVEDLYQSAHKLGATQAEIDQLLYRSGFTTR